MANPLTLTNPAYDTTGKKFGSAALNGGFGYVAGLITSLPFTVECWFSTPSAPASIQVIFGQSRTFYCGMMPSGVIQFQYGGPGGTPITVTSGVSVADGLYHHAAISVSASGGVFTVDGAVIANMTAGQVAAATAAFSVAGSEGSGGQGYLGVRAHGGEGATYMFLGEVDEAAVFSVQKYTGAFIPAAAAYAGSEANLLALWHLDGNGNDSAATSTTIVPGNLAVVYSPYGWSGGKTINAGGYFRTLFTGSSVALTFDMSAQVAPYPQIWVSIDGQAWQQFTLAASIAPAMPPATSGWGQHHLEVVVKSTSAYGVVPRWSPQAAAVILSGITLAVGATVTAPSVGARNILVFGDSITEGNYTVQIADTDGSDAALGWAYRLRHLLGAEVGVVGMSAQGLTHTGQGGVPVLGSAFNLMWSGQARSFTPTPSLIIINQGTNDGGASSGTMQAAFQAFLSALIAAVPTCPIAVLRPFGGSQAAAIQIAIVATGSPRVHYLDTTGLFNTTLSTDGLHPLGISNIASIAPGLAAKLLPLLTGVANPWSRS